MIDKSASKLLCCKSRHQRWYQYSLYPRQWTLPRRNVVSTGGVPVKEPPAIIRTDIVRLRCGIVDKPSSAPRGRSSSRNTATKTSRFWKLLQMPGPPTGSSHWSTGTHKEARCDGGYSSASLGTSPPTGASAVVNTFSPLEHLTTATRDHEARSDSCSPRRNGRFSALSSQHLLRRCSLLPMG